MTQKTLKIQIVRFRGTIGPLIMNELALCFEELGHEVKIIDIADFDFSTPGPELFAHIEKFIKDIKDFAPDLALTYGESGLLRIKDKDGSVTNAFEMAKVPYAAVFYDDPLQALPFICDFKDSGLMHVFCWDKYYISRLKEEGFSNVFYLPLATNTKTFTQQQTQAYTQDISFVGTSASGIYNPNLSLSPILKNIIELGRKALHNTQPSALNVWAIIDACTRQTSEHEQTAFENFKTVQPEKYRMFAGYMRKILDWEYRTTMLAGSPSEIKVYGDDGWKNKDNINAQPELAYGQDLAKIYAQSRINLNLTSFQMVEAVNQRVFDVPAAGGFVLSDYRQSLEELFEPETECVFFNNKEQMQEKIVYYLKHENERTKIAECARNRITQTHQWTHRAKEILDRVRP